MSDLSTHHADLVVKVRGMIMQSMLPSELKLAYMNNQLEILGRMTPDFADLHNQNLKATNFFSRVRDLTADAARTSPLAAAALKAGRFVGGTFDRGNGMMRLDGGSTEASAAHIAGHEATHSAEGKMMAVAQSEGWQNAWEKEIKGGAVGEYATEDVHEGLAEVMGMVLSGRMSTEALWSKFPLTATELEGHGWIAEREGAKTFNVPADVFSGPPINDGTLHADTLRLHVSKSDIKEGANVAISWAGRIKEAALDMFDNNIRPAFRMVQAATKGGYSPAIGMDLVNVWERLQYADKDYADDMRNNGMATLANGKWTRTGASWEHVIAPLTEEDKAPIDGRKSVWQNVKDWFDTSEKYPVSKFDLFATARHIVDEASRGQFVVPEDQVPNFQQVLADFAVDPAFVARATQVADALTQHVYNASLDARASPDVHNLTQDQVNRLKAAHPTYIETTRVQDEHDFIPRQQGGVKGKEVGRMHEREGNSAKNIVPPLVTAYNRYQKTASIVLEQIRRNAMAEVLKMNLPGWSEAGDEKVKFEIEKDGLKAEQMMRKLNMSQAEVDAFLAQIEALGASAQAYFIQKPWSAKTPNLFWWKDQNGNLTNFKILDKSLYELATGQQGNGNAVIELLRAAGNIGFNTSKGRLRLLPAMTQTVKAGATTASAAFQINNTLNPTRDPLTFLTNTIDQTTAKDLPAMIARVYLAEGNALRGKTDDVLFQMFKQARGDATKMFPAKNISNLGSSKIEFLKQILSTAQAGELAPRFLEFKTRLAQLGWNEQRVNEEVAKAKASPGGYQDPIPFGVILEASRAASEVTGPFSRGGVMTGELNKIVPFFQPSVAVLAKQMRNWKDNTKGASIAMAAYLGLKMLHFLMYKDEDWYKELNAYDRFNNFVVPIGGKLRRIQGARGFEVPVGGTMTSILEKMYGQRPDLVGLLEQSYGSVAPPAPIPPIASVAWQLQGNQDWLGRPIVPSRDEHLSAWEKAKQYQLPYGARQLTGGRGEVSVRGLGLNPVADAGTPHRSVDEAFARLESLTEARTLARRQGTPFPQEGEYTRMNHIVTSLRGVSQALRGELVVGGRVVKGPEPSEERAKLLRARQLELARLAAKVK